MNKKHLLCGAGSLSLLLSLNNMENVKAFENETIYLNKELKTSEDIVFIEDKNLLKAINNQLGRGEILDDVTIGDMESLTLLKAHSRNITSIKGLEFASNLTELHLYDNKISNINPLKNLVNLERLYLGYNATNGNNVDNITSLEGLVNLRVLHLGRNNVSSLNSLRNLTRLTELYVECNNLKSISGIENLTNLTKLYFYGNEVSNLEPVRNLNNLTHLYAGNYEHYYGWQNYGNRIEDLSPINNLINLKALRLENNRIENISLIKDLTNLNYLSLDNNKISDIEHLNKLVNLNTLTLKNNKISNISSVRNLVNLTTLYLEGNNISNIECLSTLKIIVDLNLQNNKIEDVSTIRELRSLKNLNISRNLVSDISFLSDLENLVVFHSSYNSITNIPNLDKLASLEIFDLQYNNIEDISNISKLINLKTLNLEKNLISNISSLDELSNLENLTLAQNSIEDISNISSLLKLRTLNLYRNNVYNLSPLSGLTSLTLLNIDSNNVSELDEISELINLNVLYCGSNNIEEISSINRLTKIKTLRIDNNNISDISVIKNMPLLEIFVFSNNQVEDIRWLKYCPNIWELIFSGNKVYDISVLEHLDKLVNIHAFGQKPDLNVDYFTDTFVSNISIDVPIKYHNKNNLNITNISNGGIYEEGNLKWSNLSLGNHTRTFNFKENVKIGSKTIEFSGTATIDLNIIDGGAPESDHTSEFDESDFGIYATVTATDLGEGVSHLIHKGIRHSLPYRFKYDVYNPVNNVVEVYDLAGNKADYQVKLKDSDIPTIEEGLNALIAKDDTSKEDISYFRAIVNDLDESSNKDLLQDRLNNIFPNTFELERKNTTGNLDVYIKSQNMLSMSLDTNSVTFDGYSGTEDMEKLGAVNISINSSLPYQLNAYMPSEISNSDKSETMDMDILKIKESNESIYQRFANTTDKIVLKDSCNAGNNSIHNIDLKLSSNLAHKADVYKAVIKFEAEQK